MFQGFGIGNVGRFKKKTFNSFQLEPKKSYLVDCIMAACA